MTVLEIPDPMLHYWMRRARLRLDRFWNHPQFDDMLSHAYLKTWAALKTLAAKGEPPCATYIMRAAERGAADFFRSRENRTAAASRHGVPNLEMSHTEWVTASGGRKLEEVAGCAALPYEEIHWRIDLGRLIRELPSPRVESFRLVCLEGMEIEDAARLLGKTRGSVRNDLYQAARMIREALAKADAGHEGRADESL